MRFQCPFCRGIVSVEDTDMGTDVQCGHCGERVTVPASRVATGAVIGDFILLRELGRGGMGIVYLAHQISLDRPAALKILAENYANNAEFVVGFIKEARAAAKLNHPNIVQAYAVGEDEGIFYFAMEYIDGETMKDVLKREHVIPVDQAISIIQQISEALDYAWKEQMLIHRDIKPDNIMLTTNGRAKLADLGLAKVAGEIDDSEDDEVMGTPQYISPEHLTGAPMDSRSDIYSLGATFYHFLTGRFPYEGASATEIAQQHLFGTLVPPREVNPEIPETLSRIVEKMMAKDPALRYQDAAELADDLRLVRRGQSPVSATATGAMRVINSNMNLHEEGSRKSGLQLKLKSQNAQTQQFTQTDTVSENPSFKNAAKEITSGASTEKQESELFSAEKLAKAEEMAKKAAASKGRKKNFQQAARENERKRKIVRLTVAVILVVLLGGGAFFGYQYRKQLAEIFHSGSIGDAVTTESGKKQNSYLKDITQTLTMMTRDSSDRESVIKAAEEFLASHPADPETDEEKAKLKELLNLYIPADEERLASLREDARKTYSEQIEAKERAAKEAAEAERQRKAAEAERQRKAAEARRLEEQKRLQQQREINSYKARYTERKALLDRSVIAFIRKGDEAGLMKMLDDNCKEPQLVKDKHLEIRKMANVLAGQSNQIRTYIRGAFELRDIFRDGHPKLAGVPVEIRFNFCKVKSIKNGVLTGMTDSGKEVSIPIQEMNPRSRAYMQFVLKAAKSLNKPQMVPFYFLCLKEYQTAKTISDNTDLVVQNRIAGAQRLISNLLKAYLTYALKQPNENKNDLQHEFGRTAEYKELTAPKKKK